MPDPLAELQKISTQAMELLKVPFTVPLAVGGALIEGAKVMTHGGRLASPTEMLAATAKVMEATTPPGAAAINAILKGSEIVGGEKKLMYGQSRTTIF